MDFDDDANNYTDCEHWDNSTWGYKLDQFLRTLMSYSDTRPREILTALRKNKELASILVQTDAKALTYFDIDIKNDIELISQAIKTDPRSIYTLDPSIIYTPDILQVFAQSCMDIDGSIGEYIEPLLGESNNDDFLTFLIQFDGLLLQYGSPELKQNYEVVLMAVTQNGWALEYADATLQNNYDIVLTAVQHNSEILQHVSDDLRNNRNIIDAALSKAFDQPYIMPGDAFRLASPSLRNTYDLVQDLVQKNGLLLQYASPNLQKNKNLVLLAVSQNGTALEFADPQLQNDPDIVNAAIQNNCYALQYASPELRNKFELVEPAIKNCGSLLEHVSSNLKANYNLVLLAVKQNGRALQFADPQLQNDNVIVHTAIQNDPRALQYASPSLRNITSQTTQGPSTSGRPTRSRRSRYS